MAEEGVTHLCVAPIVMSLIECAPASRAAWGYDRAAARFDALAGPVAFHAGLVDEAWAGELRVSPQPGDFYGGWVTSNLDGQIRGAP